MRLLYVGPVPPIRGGIAQHGHQLVRALRDAGHEVEVLTWRNHYPRLVYKGDQPVNAAFPSDVSPVLSWFNPFSWGRARRLSASFELVIVQWVHPFHALPLGTILRGTPAPTVSIVHNAIPHERFPLARTLTRFALGTSGSIVTHSSEQAKEIARLLGRDDVRVVQHPPNLLIQHVAPPRTPPWRLLFAGYVREYKGVDTAIEALGRLRAAGVDAELTVMGSFWEPETGYRSLVDRLGLERHVTMLNRYVSDDELAASIQDHHILVMPYKTATQSGVIPLALSAGRPIVATQLSGLVEQVPPGGGFTAPPGDADRFAAAVELCIDNYDATSAAAKAGAPSWDAVVETVIDPRNGP